MFSYFYGNLQTTQISELSPVTENERVRSSDMSLVDQSFLMCSLENGCFHQRLLRQAISIGIGTILSLLIVSLSFLRLGWLYTAQRDKGCLPLTIKHPTVSQNVVNFQHDQWLIDYNKKVKETLWCMAEHHLGEQAPWNQSVALYCIMHESQSLRYAKSCSDFTFSTLV